ncbi:glycerate kinase [Nocardioides soli]|uniref:Glycerate kinase n=1 Tax=Nocardioides soli TaxID=1036020 RepID=A0A7W4Z116_9ACTN|nr:glycerate kinase [Nocardioides soli]MBB3042889.1 glycerate kinase [Nocardioides soli]
MSTTDPGPRVLVAPDSFKGTMSAAVVADALAAGVREAGGETDVCPVADGGEGTLEALRASVPGTDVEHAVIAPDGRQVWASYLLSEDGRTAVVETASASGLHLIDPETVDAYAATSAGTGQLLTAAASSGVAEIVLGVGGSGFSDGGLGALAAIEAGGGLGRTRLVVLCDVVTTYQDAARVYGPQKGADPESVERLTERLDTVASSFPRDPREVARTGAAGGLAGALWAGHDAELVSGIDEVLRRVGFEDRLARADLVLTGEGRLDSQTAQGKVIDGVTRWARAAAVPVYAAVGQHRAEPAVLAGLGIADVREAGTPEQLRAAARDITRQHIAVSGSRTRK